jgi:hypothetical protein
MAAATTKEKKGNDSCSDGEDDELIWSDERAAQLAASLRKKEDTGEYRYTGVLPTTTKIHPL